VGYSLSGTLKGSPGAVHSPCSMLIRFVSDSSDSLAGVNMTWFAEMPVRPRSHAGEEQYRVFSSRAECVVRIPVADGAVRCPVPRSCAPFGSGSVSKSVPAQMWAGGEPITGGEPL
jgi:hypothetical protein